MPRSPHRHPRRVVASMALAALVLMVGACSEDGTSSTASDRKEAAESGGRDGAHGTGGSSDATGSGANDEAALEAARADSHAPSGIAGVPAPNDDDGARNLASVDPQSGPQAQDTSGSVAADPLSSPTPTSPDPGRPDLEGLPPLDWCGDVTAPFYRAVSKLGPTVTTEQVVDGTADLTLVVQRAQAPIADAARLLLTTAQTAAADAARIPDLGGAAFQDAVRAVHVYLRTTCGR